MGLVDYSDSESDSEDVQHKIALPTTTSASAAATKKPFQKLLDRSSGSGKIVVNLPAASANSDAAADDDGQPPAKRVKTTGGSRFSSLGSFLPPPKKTGGAAAAAAGGKKLGTAHAPGIHLRTAAEPAFVRSGNGTTEDGHGDDETSASTMGIKGPSIPEGQKPEEEVKLVGKPLMFKPLSVARKKAPAKSKKKDSPTTTGNTAGGMTAGQTGSITTATTTTAAAETAPNIDPPKKKVPLFSMGDADGDSSPSTTTAPPTTGSYEPLFTGANEPSAAAAADFEEQEENDVTSAYPTQALSLPQPVSAAQQHQHQDSLASLADSLDLSPAARRELFGRKGANNNNTSLSGALPPNAKVVTFDMEQEYARNEALRASGAQQAYNPVRSIAPGKHSLRQVVNMAQSNQSALEDSFARAKGTKRDAAGRYGWK
ncbi:hypothetical protein N656DRAFT_501949 [Canariomyces notabilis]|uniref:Mitotic checkpoint regulator, MAD2B-interacting-domain-containing protein n=1 Tax=Canariomyces notabilis TaxID=2074819 RepID=A0AAN6YVV0_9PEZI|nr:hypothetical protein N656DRAFT_501949 [Canariomyces arenarius]